MHVMEIVSGHNLNGAVLHCRLVIRELLARGHRVTLVCRPGARIAEDVAGERLEVVFSELRRWPPDELRRIASIARRTGVEVLHTHLSRAHFFGVLLRWFSGLPSVATAQSRLIQAHWLLNDLVIAASEATRKFHRRYNLVRADRIVTIHNFIDDARIAAVTAADRQRIRREVGADNGTILVGVLGSVDHRKSQHDLVHVLPQLLTESPNTRVLLAGVAGPEWYMERLHADAERLGVAHAVRWLGHRDDVPDVLAALDIFVLPSREEQLPLSILEAMYTGLPVVGTTVGGVPECVEPGRNGFLVRPGDRRALGEALGALIRDPALRRRMGEAGRETVRRRFSIQSQVAAIEAALQDVVRRRGPQSRAA